MAQTLLKNARLIDGIADQPQERMSILGREIGDVAGKVGLWGSSPSPAREPG
jgi:hypothetical protein